MATESRHQHSSDGLPLLELAEGIGLSMYPEAIWLRRYIETGERVGKALMLSIGESWQGPPLKLVKNLAASAAWTHGYQLSTWGTREYRQSLDSYFKRTGYIASDGNEGLLIAGVSGGTRGLIFDFGRMLVDSYQGTWTAVCPDLGWEYEEVLFSSNIKFQRVATSLEANFVPDATAFVMAIEEASKIGSVLVVINAQHNPTGANWPESLLLRIYETVLNCKCALLIDDAHYALCDDNIAPTPALRLWLNIISGLPSKPALSPWLATRSLSKEFSCNGWALGACVTNQTTVSQLTHYRSQRTLSVGAHLQSAMSVWLNDSLRADKWIAKRRLLQRKAREEVHGALLRLGWSPSDISNGSCTPFLVFKVPMAFRATAMPSLAFTRWCIEQCGVVITPLGTSAPSSHANQLVRMYLGGPAVGIHEGLRRIEDNLPLTNKRDFIFPTFE